MLRERRARSNRRRGPGHPQRRRVATWLQTPGARVGRHEELIALLDSAPTSLWRYREWRVKALAAMGRKAEAMRYAEASRGLNGNPIAIARACEEILIASGLADGAYALRDRGQPGDDASRDLARDGE